MVTLLEPDAASLDALREAMPVPSVPRWSEVDKVPTPNSVQRDAVAQHGNAGIVRATGLASAA